jgi:hypothetical protein
MEPYAEHADKPRTRENRGLGREGSQKFEQGLGGKVITFHLGKREGGNVVQALVFHGPGNKK